MALFGSQGLQALGQFDPAGLTPQDKLMLLGATLRDTGAALRGGQGDAILNTQALLSARRQEAQKQAWRQKLAGLFGSEAASGYGGLGPGADGEPLQPRPQGSGVPTMQTAFPVLAEGALSGNPEAASMAALIKSAQPAARVPLNTSHGVREYDPSTGGYRTLETFPEKPEKADPVTIDRVIGQILSDMAGGKKLTPPQQQIYRRWFSGTPSKATGGGGGSSGLPPGFQLDK